MPCLTVTVIHAWHRQTASIYPQRLEEGPSTAAPADAPLQSTEVGVASVALPEGGEDSAFTFAGYTLYTYFKYDLKSKIIKYACFTGLYTLDSAFKSD